MYDPNQPVPRSEPPIAYDSNTPLSVAQRYPMARADREETDNEVGAERFFDGVRARIIDLTTLSWPIRLALGLAALLLLALGATLVLHDASLPRLTGLPVDQHATQAPLFALLLGVIALGLAWTMALAGAFRAHWLARILILLLFTLTQGPTILLALTDGGLLLVGGLLELGAVVALWLWGVTTIFLDRPTVRRWLFGQTPQRSGESGTVSSGERAITLLTVSLVPFAFLISVAAELGADLRYPGYNFTLAALSIRLSALFLLLLPALMLAGTDAAEWGELVVGRLAFLAGHDRRRRRLRILTLSLTILCLGDVAYDLVVRLQPASPLITLILLLCPSLLLGAGAFVTFRLGRVMQWPRSELPFGAPLGIAACYFVGLIPSFFIGGSGAKLVALAVTSYLALVIGLPLLWGYRRHGGPWAATGLLFTIFGLYTLATLLVAATLGLYAAFRLPGAPHTGPEVLSLYGALAVVALVTLGVLGYFSLSVSPRRQLHLRFPGGDARAERRQLVALATLNAGLLVLVVVTRYLAGRPEEGQRYALGPVLLLVGAFLWDFLSSGEAVTNRSSQVFPRTARVLLYAGYTLTVATAVVFFGSLTFTQSNQQALAGAVDDTTWALLGAIVLGVPVLLTSCLLRLPRVHRSHVIPDESYGDRKSCPH
jgi:hypothetical protein